MKNNLNEILSLMGRTDNRFNLNDSAYRLISEGSVGIEKIYDKHYSDIDRDVFDKIINADPTTKKDMGGVKMGKYGKWLLKLYRKDKLEISNLSGVKDSLEKFDKLKKSNNHNIKSNIEDYHSIDDLDVDLDDNKDAIDKKSDKEIKEEGAMTIYDEDGLKLIAIKTLSAAILYSKGTKWCTGAKNMNRFKNYMSFSYLFVLLDSNIKMKYQIAYNKNIERVDEVRNDENKDRIETYEKRYSEKITPVIEEYANTKKNEKNTSDEDIKNRLGIDDSDRFTVKGSYENYAIIYDRNTRKESLLDIDIKKPLEIDGRDKFREIKNLQGTPIFTFKVTRGKMYLVDVSSDNLVVDVNGTSLFEDIILSDQLEASTEDFILVKANEYKCLSLNGSSLSEVMCSDSIADIYGNFTLEGKCVLIVKLINGKTAFEVIEGTTMEKIKANGEEEFDAEMKVKPDDSCIESSDGQTVLKPEDFEI